MRRLSSGKNRHSPINAECSVNAVTNTSPTTIRESYAQTTSEGSDEGGNGSVHTQSSQLDSWLGSSENLSPQSLIVGFLRPRSSSPDLEMADTQTRPQYHNCDAASGWPLGCDGQQQLGWDGSVTKSRNCQESPWVSNALSHTLPHAPLERPGSGTHCSTASGPGCQDFNFENCYCIVSLNDNNYD